MVLIQIWFPLQEIFSQNCRANLWRIHLNVLQKIFELILTGSKNLIFDNWKLGLQRFIYILWFHCLSWWPYPYVSSLTDLQTEWLYRVVKIDSLNCFGEFKLFNMSEMGMLNLFHQFQSRIIFSFWHKLFYSLEHNQNWKAFIQLFHNFINIRLFWLFHIPLLERINY